MQEITVHVVKYADRENLVMRYVDPMTGKQVQRTTRTAKQRVAEKVAAKWEAELREGRYNATSKLSWADFRELYDEQKLSTLAPGSAKAAHGAFNHLEQIISPRRLASLTPAVLSEFQTKLRQTGIRDTTITGVLGHLQAALRWAVSQGILVRAPIVHKPKRASGVDRAMRGRPITLEEFERMFEAVPRVRKHEPEKWQRLLTGLWLSGLRISEALALSWDEDAEIAVMLTGEYPKLRIWGEAQKSGRDQLLPITRDFGEFLLAVPTEARHGLVFGIEGPTPGEPLSTKRASRYISAFGEKAGVVVNKADRKFASAHDLRRAFGTRWSKHVMPATLKLLMRHSSIETTLRYYVEQDADDVAASLWKVQGEQGTNSGTTGTMDIQPAPHLETVPTGKTIAR